MKIDWTGLLSTLQADLAKAPQVLAAIQALVTKAQADATNVFPLLKQYFPKLASVSTATLAEISTVVGLLLKFEPEVMPYVLEAITLLEKFLPAA